MDKVTVIWQQKSSNSRIKSAKLELSMPELKSVKFIFLKIFKLHKYNSSLLMMITYWVAIHCQFQSWFRSERLPSDIYQSGGLSHRLFFFALWFIPIIEPLLTMYKHFHTKIIKQNYTTKRFLDLNLYAEKQDWSYFYSKLAKLYKQLSKIILYPKNRPKYCPKYFS